MGKKNARYCAKATNGSWQVWDRKLARWWGKPSKDFPQALLTTLNGKGKKNLKY